jgi:RpiB/LacA/LacB family sugar-phosphate isomerase
MKTVAIGSDHNGFQYKRSITQWLQVQGYSVVDLGQHEEKVPAPDFTMAEEVALHVADGRADSGILICGSGAGMSIAANKVHGCFAALCFNAFTAEVARTRNNANILCMGSKTIDEKMALEIVRVFLTTRFEDGEGNERNVVRNRHLIDMDETYRK